MQTITVNSFLSTEIVSEFAAISTIEMEDTPFNSGGFGEVYFCNSINGKTIKNGQVVKVFTTVVSTEKSYTTIQKLQEKIKFKNNDLIKQGKPTIADIPALCGLPQFSFKGLLNGNQVVGYCANNLDTLGFISFEKVLEDSAQYNRLPLEIRLLFCFHLAYGFEILRSINYIHADVNPQNFFINLSTGEVAVIDFDSGAIIDNPNDKPDTFGKMAESDWLAPEIYEKLDNLTTPIKVNFHTDTWSVAVGIHYLIFLRTPFFFLKDLGHETVKNYLKNNQWYEINATDPNFNTNLDYDNYTKYKTLLEHGIPKAITERLKNTFNKGYSNPESRATYDQWIIDLKGSQQPPIIDKFKVNKKPIIEGQEIEFFWTIRNVNRVTLNGKDVTNQNRFKLQPLKSDSYVLEATNLFGSVLSEKIEVEVIPIPKIELVFPTPNFSISFNRQAIQTKLPNINVMFPLDTHKLSKFDESLLTQTNGFEVEHTLRKRILKALSKVFLIISIITISLVMGFYFGTIS